MRFDGKRAALHTLGCKVNEYETDSMRASLRDAGFSIVGFDEDADVYVINTCSVTNIADRKSRQMISRAKRNHPDAVVVAAGCYVQTALDRTGKSVDADILIGTGRKGCLLEELERYFLAMDRSFRNVADVMHEPVYEELFLPRIEGHTRAFVKVQDGCNLFCSYCIIPYARGRIRSRRMEDVLAELKNLASQGIREVVLTGIHLSSYGVDFEGNIRQAYGENGERQTWQERSKLIDLIEAVAQIEGIERIRLGSLEPTIITEAFVERLRKVGKLCPHFHLSLQSGCDSVLKRMNRHYTAKEYLECLSLLRGAFDTPAVTTDVIVGFPGESEEEFACTGQFLEQAHFYETHLFRYSMRAGTKAARMPGQVPETVKEERLARLQAIDRRMRLDFERAWEDRKSEVLFEEIAQAGEDGLIQAPNSGAPRRQADVIRPAGRQNSENAKEPVRGTGTAVPAPGREKLYTGYTREYIRVYARSAEDLRGQVRQGRLGSGGVFRLEA